MSLRLVPKLDNPLFETSVFLFKNLASGFSSIKLVIEQPDLNVMAVCLQAKKPLIIDI
jgi:hypothetical protein